jgi:NhaP-type Na+/H+ or K+/H+ antiporter
MSFWEAMKLSRAMVRKHWWAIFGTLIVFGLVASAGVLACCVGTLFTGPLAFGAIVYLYEDIFRAAPAQGV